MTEDTRKIKDFIAEKLDLATKKKLTPDKQVKPGRKLKFNKAMQAEFLALFRITPSIADCARTVGISRQAVEDRRRQDPAFAEALKEAYEEAKDHLEAVAWERATKGVKKGVYYRGRKIAEETEVSDSLMLAMLKGHIPERFNVTNTNIEISGKNGGPVAFETARTKMIEMLGATIEGEIEKEEKEE